MLLIEEKNGHLDLAHIFYTITGLLNSTFPMGDGHTDFFHSIITKIVILYNNQIFKMDILSALNTLISINFHEK
jgi:hypothetical protein